MRCCVERGRTALPSCPRRCRGSSPRGSTRSARREGAAPGRRGRRQGFWPGALVAVGGVDAGQAGGAPARARAQGVRPARARAPSVGERDEYAFRHAARPRRRVRADPARGARGASTGARPTGSSRSADRAQDRAEMLAHHYLAALEFDRAAGREQAELEIAARKALRAAAERASTLHAPAAAARLYGEALELWPADDPDRDELLFRRGRRAAPVGRAGRRARGPGAGRTPRAGRNEVAAEAEVTLADDAWALGPQRGGARGARPARDLLADSPPTPVKAYVHSRFTGFLMADGQEKRRWTWAGRRWRWPRASARGRHRERPRQHRRRAGSRSGTSPVSATSPGASSSRNAPGRPRSPQPVQSRERVREPRGARARVRPLRERAEAARKLGIRP